MTHPGLLRQRASLLAFACLTLTLAACSLAGDVSPFPAGSLTGKVALIERGTCNLSEKVFNAQRGGAVAAFVYNNAAGGDNVQALTRFALRHGLISRD